MKIVLDGSRAGIYRGDCECGFSWHGMGERLPDGCYSPALPIAEAVVHVDMCHEQLIPELRFTARYKRWLFQHWTRADSMNGLGQATMTR